jgi:hypothetical protein
MYKPNHHFIYFFNKNYTITSYSKFTHINIDIEVSVSLTQLIRYWIIYLGDFGFEIDYFTYSF